MATSKVPLVPGTKTLARGSVVIGNASGEPSALAIGSNTYVLKSDGTDISWGADAAGTITAFTNGVDNRVVTATSATALNGETNLIYNGTILGCGATGASADLGNGIHVRTADSSADVNGDASQLVLENNGACGLSILSSTSTSGWINFGDSGDNDIGGIQYNHDNNGMFFFTNTAQQMCILSDGDVGIGEANPAGKLEVKGDADTDIARFRTGTDGRQIKMMNPSDTQVGGIAINASDTQYVTTSDYRLKENETSITDGITRLKTLKPYRFNFKVNTDKTVDGFFAHEVTAVPEAVTGEKDDMHPEVLYTAEDELPEGKNIGDIKEEAEINPQGIDQSKLVPLLVASLQEAITKIETLETKVTALENK